MQNIFWKKIYIFFKKKKEKSPPFSQKKGKKRVRILFVVCLPTFF
jgi:hypothetical protein